MDNLDSVYSEIIMDASMDKSNKYKMEDATDSLHSHNPSCGDDITIDIKLNGNIVENISYIGSGCAISEASTTIMIDLFKGKTKEEILNLIEIFFKMIKRESLSDFELEKIEEAQAFKNISNMPARVKCAELAWHTMKELLKD